MGKMSKYSFWMCIIWTATHGIFTEDKSSICALMAILFAVFYLAERTNGKE